MNDDEIKSVERDYDTAIRSVLNEDGSERESEQ